VTNGQHEHWMKVLGGMSYSRILMYAGAAFGKVVGFGE